MRVCNAAEHLRTLAAVRASRQPAVALFDVPHCSRDAADWLDVTVKRRMRALRNGSADAGHELCDVKNRSVQMLDRKIILHLTIMTDI